MNPKTESFLKEARELLHTLRQIYFEQVKAAKNKTVNSSVAVSGASDENVCHLEG